MNGCREERSLQCPLEMPIHSITAGAGVLKWLLVIMVGVVLIGALRPWLLRFGLGRMPGDVVLRWRGRDYPMPIASTLVLSAILSLLARLL